MKYDMRFSDRDLDWSPALVLKAIYDPIWRTKTALGRKVASSIIVEDVYDSGLLLLEEEEISEQMVLIDSNGDLVI